MTNSDFLKAENPKKEKAKRSRGRPKGTVSADDVYTRKNILDAALKTFSVHGYEGGSIAKIARLHRVSPPLIHYYFKDKEELWRAAINHGIGNMIEELQEIISHLSEVDSLNRLKFFVRRFIALIAERPDVFSLIIRESEITGPRLDWLSKNYLNPLYSVVLGLVEDAQEEGVIKNSAPSYHIVQVIMGACYHFISSRNRMMAVYGIDTHSREMRE
ncbi:MAG: TetR/AcrR family transcriptional regulator [Emcibacter sp.]|nr:TetR/AcrR family transcriptional regulator [Emcibacter sp.]